MSIVDAGDIPVQDMNTVAQVLSIQVRNGLVQLLLADGPPAVFIQYYIYIYI